MSFTGEIKKEIVNRAFGGGKDGCAQKKAAFSAFSFLTSPLRAKSSKDVECPQRESNPYRGLERAVS